MKHILMIGTGGTIASEKTPSGLTPELNTEQLLSFIPGIADLCHVDCLQLYSLDSTNICPRHWLGLAAAIRDRYDDYDGFVIAHGTDTMAYTAAALSYLVQGSPKPIVLTGAQKPIWFDGTDSKRNLTDAFLYACRGCGGVQIVFNGKVILGTRARKTCSKSYHAFSSVNYPDLAVVQDGRLLQYMRCTCYPRPVFYNTLDDRVSLLKLIPGTSSAADRLHAGPQRRPHHRVLRRGRPAGVSWQRVLRCGAPRRGAGQDRGHDHPGAQRGQRPDGLPCGRTR